MFSDLREILKNNDKKLFNDTLLIRDKTIPLLSKIKDTFPEYTPHEIEHSDKVIEILNWFIPKKLKNKLKTYEIYFLISASYLHDVGMANLDEIKGFHSENVDSIREYHHLRSEKYIIENFNKLGIANEHQAKIIGKICSGHRKENLLNDKLFDPERMYSSYPINMPLLSFFLRIADELDLTFERTPYKIYESVPIKDKISKEEWKRHFYTSGTGLSEENPLKIKCSVSCKNLKIHRALKQLETKINDELYNVEKYLHHYREFIKDIPDKFFVDIEPEGYTVHDFKFSLQEKEIINLLMGEKLYKQKEESIRELLKNSIDGCKLRKEILKKRGLSYDPTILFEITPNKDVIIVIDDGVGMDEVIIERYLTKIGKSFYTSSEFLDEGFEITPVNELGIGILSYFMIANKIVIDTKTENSESILIEIDDISDYFFVREGEREDIGTTVILFLKDDFKEIHLKENIIHFARHLEFPIMVTDSDKLYAIKNTKFEPVEYENTDDWHIIKVDEEYCEGIIGLVLKKNEPNYLDRDDKPYYLSNEGIFVGHIDPLPRYFYNEHYTSFYLDLNLKKNVLDLNIARNDIVKNDKFDLFQERLSKILINEFEKIFKNLRISEENPEKLINGFFHVYIKDRYFSYKLRKDIKIVFPDFLMDFIKKNYYFKCISKEGFYFRTYDELIKFEKKMKPLEIYSCSDKHLQKVFFNCPEFEDEYIYVDNNHFFELLFDIPKLKLESIIKMKDSDELDGLIPKSWRTVKFLNYETSSLLEFAVSYGNITILNRDNRFIDLIIRGKKKILNDREIAMNGFFRGLRRRLKYNFDEIIKEQKIILKWFIDDGLIDKEEIENYILKKEDFPTYFDDVIKI